MFTIIGGDGKEYGPVTTEQVQAWLTGGRANLDTKAKRAGDTQWGRLGDFPEFANASAAAPNTAVAPLLATPASPGLELADRLSRLGAVLLDQLIALACVLPGALVLFASGLFTDPNNPNMGVMVAGFCLMGVALIGLLLYQIHLLGSRGQTIGKKIVGVKIVNYTNEGNPGITQAFLMRAVVSALPSFIPFVGGIYSIVDICFIFRDDRRCIHDLIAGTKVVKA